MLNSAFKVFAQFYNSAVVCSWIFNLLRLGSGLFLLPLLLQVLSVSEFGMYCVLYGLGSILPIIDFGFSVSIGRSVSYAMGGAHELRAEGLVPSKDNSNPNFSLLWKLLYATQQLYRYLALAALIIVGCIGTMVVTLRIHQTESIATTWLAWALTLASIVWEVYSGWWNIFLRGTNQVLLATRIATVAYALNISLAAILLVGGAGLLSVPAASLIGNLAQRQLARRFCLKFLGPAEQLPAAEDVHTVLTALWPNSWRLGVQLLTGYLSANLVIFLKIFDLSANAEFGLSMRIMYILQSMSSVVTAVKWPLIGQYRARQDFEALRKLLKARLWLQSLGFTFFAVFAVVCGQAILDWSGSDKRLLPATWLALLALNSFLEMRFSFWGTLISTENRMPFVWPTVATNLLSIALSIILLKITSLQLSALVLGPLIAGGLFNYWYWPMAGAKTLQTRWFHFTFFRAG